MPGNSPRSASWRKQIRHIPTNRMYPRGRPQRLHRLWWRTANFGGRFHFSIMHFFANANTSAGSIPRLEQVYANEVVPAPLSDFGYKNPMETPRPTKIVLNIGIGEVIGIAGRLNMDIVQRASDDLATITGPLFSAFSGFSTGAESASASSAAPSSRHHVAGRQPLKVTLSKTAGKLTLARERQLPGVDRPFPRQGRTVAV